MGKKLSTYGTKRSLKKTKEPRATVQSSYGNPAFVIQKHDASRLHYDLRLEVGGVMKSWAVPKGPSLNPCDKRLAVLVEDHPLAYKNFEGVIPKGEYGVGTVIIWDRGRYRNLTKNAQGKPLTMETAFQRGTIEVRLSGKKLKGDFALVRMQGKNWLLIKMKDAYANTRKNIVQSEPRSVKSGKTLAEVKKLS